jgi:hypothetical protein
MGYVAVAAGGAETEVIMSSRSAATTFAGLLPANVTASGAVADARVFAYAEAAGGGGARARVEGAVRVTPVVGKGASEVAADALKAAMKLGDPALRAAAAVTAAASLNTRSAGDGGLVSAALNASEIAARKEVRAGAMTAVADAAAAMLADTTLELDPEVLSSHVSAIAAVAAAPAELTASTAARGVATLTGLLRAKASQPADTATVRTATSMLSGAIQVAFLNKTAATTPPPPSPPPSNATDATSGRRHLTRRLLQDDVATNSTANATTTASPPKIDPLVAAALDASVALVSGVVRGQAPGETGTSIEEEHLSISASRHPPGDLAGGGGPFKAPHAAAGSYYLPPMLAAAVATHTHADVFLFRVNGAMLPSATRIMSDGSSIEVIGGDGLRPGLPDTDEITVHVPLVGSGLQTLEKVLYEYRCARHVAGVWDPDDPLVRTVSVTETAPGVGHVTCAGKGVAFLGYVVGAVIAPINFTLANLQTGEDKPTANGYWYVMGATMAAALLFGAFALFCGMRRNAVKISHKDRGGAHKPAS